MNLKGRIETGRCVPGENATQARSEGGSGHNGQRPLSRLGVQCQ
jgi:hypothetical protein